MRRELLEDEGNTERWMISYADFITLLFAFFVVMYAISSVNDEKYRVLSSTLSEAFAVEAASLDPIQVGEPTLRASPHLVDIPNTEGWADDEYGDTFIRDVGDQQTPLGGFAAQEGVAVDVNHEWLEIDLGAELLFASGTARLSTNAQTILQPLVAVLENSENPITIEGYTDNVPPPAQGSFGSNWTLSGARASSIAEFLVASGIRQNRIAAIGYGENHPLATNATPEGRAANRRVSVIVARRATLSRNRNAIDASNVPAVVTHIRSPGDDAPIPQRTNEGGLLFSNEIQDAGVTRENP